MNKIRYKITPYDLSGHRFEVSITLPYPHRTGQRISLPAWIPGSYMLRDFARHVEELQIHCGHETRPHRKIDTHTWEFDGLGAESVQISYRVYAWDTSVRAAYLDEKRGFFNGTSVFLQIHGREDEPCLLEICPPKGKKKWRVYTSLPEAEGIEGSAKRHGFGLYLAPNYDALIDHPVELGTPQLVIFEACGATHEMVFSGEIPNLDLKRIAQDCKKICEYQITLFDPSNQEAPFLDSSDRYVFMTFVTGNDYGGLEHRSSTALIASRNDLPVKGDSKQTDAYRKFLGLVSHEYFHTWNVKRIKPQVFAPYNLYRENHTSLLWIFEGFTAYYDDLCLLRSGVITQDQYLQLMQKNIEHVMNTPGRYKMSVAQSSFDAWSKYYKQDENAINSLISYYIKGALVAWCLDLHIRNQSTGHYSLDDVMRYLWQQFGKNFYPHNKLGLKEDQFPSIVKQATGVDVEEFVRKYAYSTEDIPLNDFLKPQGLYIEWQYASNLPSLNVRTQIVGEQLQLAQVLQHGAAHEAGLSAGDYLVAINGLRVTSKNLEQLLTRYQPGAIIKVHVFRRDELRRFKVRLNPSEKGQCKIKTQTMQVNT